MEYYTADHIKDVIRELRTELEAEGVDVTDVRALCPVLRDLGPREKKLQALEAVIAQFPDIVKEDVSVDDIPSIKMVGLIQALRAANKEAS